MVTGGKKMVRRKNNGQEEKNGQEDSQNLPPKNKLFKKLTSPTRHQPLHNGFKCFYRV